MRRSTPAVALIVGWVLLGGGTVALAQEAAPAEKKAGTAVQPHRATPGGEVLRRLQELEAQVAQFQEEIARLRAELAQKQGPAAVSPVQQKPAAAKDSAGGEWDEPEVDKKQEGRDEEARRRLMALETQVRKFSAEAAKLQEALRKKTNFDFSGKYKARVNSRHNFNLENPLQQWEFDNATYFDHRFQLQIDASHEVFLTRLVLDKGNFVFDWKEDSEGTLERWGQFQTVGAPLVRELFVQYTGPFMLRIGRQNWDVGHALTLEGPMDAVRFQYPLGQLPWGQTSFSAGYMGVAGGWRSYTKFRESGPPAGSRDDLFSASNKLDAYYLDLDIRPSRALRLRPYLLKAVDRGGLGDADLNLDKDFNAATAPRDGRFEPLWAGVAASADLKSWKFDAEAVSLSGDYTQDRKVSANALLLKAARDFGKVGSLRNLAMGLEFGRGSGNGTADASTGTLRNFNALFLCRDRHKFGNIFSEDLRAGYFLWDSNLSNITYVRLDGSFEPLKDLKLRPAVARIWTTEEVFAGRGPVFDWSRGTATSTRRTKDVGWEIDFDGTYPLLPKLEGFFSLGYFRPGAVYARADGNNPKRAFEVILGAEFGF